MFFTKYIPVEGEIKEGDYWMHPNGAIFPWTSAYEKGPIAVLKPKKVKLFLCTRDIKVGDEITDGKTTKVVNSQDYLDKLMVLISSGEVGKIIGEISPDALSYVKEGMEYTDGEIKEIVYKGLSMNDIATKFCKIKAPCGHFH